MESGLPHHCPVAVLFGPGFGLWWVVHYCAVMMILMVPVVLATVGNIVAIEGVDPMGPTTVLAA